MKKVAAVCEHCGVTFYPKRKSAKFHNDACRIAHHRAMKRDKLRNKVVYWYLDELFSELQLKETSWQAAKEIVEIRKFLDSTLEPITHWWCCDSCKQSIMKFVPADSDCECGRAARWYIVNR